MDGLSDRLRRVERILGLEDINELKLEFREVLHSCDRLARRIEFLEHKMDGDNKPSTLGQNTFGMKEAEARPGRPY